MTVETKQPLHILIDKDTFELITKDPNHTYYMYCVHEYVQGQDIFYIRKPFSLYQ